MRVCHISVLHFRHDLRILVRQCQSLADHGFEVHYLVADGRGDEKIGKVQIHDIGIRPTFIKRLLFTHIALFKKALSIDADLYQFHDPELMMLGLALKAKKKVVIADVHEDVPMQFLGSPNHSGANKWIKSKLISWIETFTFPKLDAIITASPIVKRKIQKITGRVVNIGCFPDLKKEFSPEKIKKTPKKYDLVYLGSISSARGILETVDLIEGTNITYALAGDLQGNIEGKLVNKNAWDQNTIYFGFLEDREKLINILMASRIGMATVLPAPNFATTYLIKMFEYMAAGIPVIATDFPFWRSIIDRHQCGICVDPENKEECKRAVEYLLKEKELANQMGHRGRLAVEQEFNWEREKKKLLALYQELLQNL